MGRQLVAGGVREYDVSMPLFPGMPAFPGDPPFTRAPAHALARGDAYNLSTLSLGTHTGTHVDPPLHFLPNGAGVDRLDLARLSGPCVLVPVATGIDEIGPREVAEIPSGATRAIFRTANSARWARSLEFFTDYVALSPAGARALVTRGVGVVGIDSLSIERDPAGTFPVHHALLAAGVLILEGLLLDGVPAGEYEMDCFPLKIRDGDGGPARVRLRSR